jgi:hypothetical protein
MNSNSELVYKSGAMSSKELQLAADQAWTNIMSDPNLAGDSNLHPSEVDAMKSVQSSPYRISARGQGLSPEDVLIVVSINVFSSMSYDVLKYVWMHYIFPRIKKRGIDAVGPEV